MAFHVSPRARMSLTPLQRVKPGTGNAVWHSFKPRSKRKRNEKSEERGGEEEQEWQKSDIWIIDLPGGENGIAPSKPAKKWAFTLSTFSALLLLKPEGHFKDLTHWFAGQTCSVFLRSRIWGQPLEFLTLKNEKAYLLGKGRGGCNIYRTHIEIDG